MGLGVDVRIDSQGHPGLQFQAAGDAVDLLQLLGGLQVKQQDVRLEGRLDLRGLFAHPGVDDFLKKTFKYVETLETVIIANVAGRSIDDYVYVINKLNDTRIDFFELNISCPNVSIGGASIGTDETMTRECVKQAKAASRIMT